MVTRCKRHVHHKGQQHKQIHNEQTQQTNNTNEQHKQANIHEAQPVQTIQTRAAGAHLDDIGASHHADDAGAVDVVEGPELARRENRLQMRLTARLAHTHTRTQWW